MGVGGSNLTGMNMIDVNNSIMIDEQHDFFPKGAFKLIFKIAKIDTNDALFVETDLPELMVDALGRISPLNGENGKNLKKLDFYRKMKFQTVNPKVQFTVMEQFVFLP